MKDYNAQYEIDKDLPVTEKIKKATLEHCKRKDEEVFKTLTEKEFKLSEKMLGEMTFVFAKKDVKEFIRLLKESFTKDIKNRKLKSEKTVLGQFNYRIDKLSGDLK